MGNVLKTIVLVEEGIEKRYLDPAFWSDETFYIAPLAALNTIEGQFVGGPVAEARVGNLVNGIILGAILNGGDRVEDRQEFKARLARIMQPEFADDAIFDADGPQRPERLVAWLLARHTFASSKFAAFSAQSDLALAALRKSFLSCQESLRAAEAALTRRALTNLTLLDAIPGCDYFLAPARAGGDLPAVSQRTWRDVKSFKRLDLKFRPGHGSGHVTVRVYGAHSGRLLGTWARAYQNLADGWNPFTRPQDVGQLEEPIRVDVKWSDATGAPTIEMAAAVADDALAATTSNGQKLDRPVALRIWKSLWDPPAEGADEEQNPDEFPMADVITPSDLLPLISYYDGPSHADREQLLRWVESEGAALVHPAGRQPMIGVIRRVEAKNLRRVTAGVRLIHPDAAGTEVAVLAVPASQNIRSDNRSRVSELRRYIGLGGEAARALVKKAQWLRLGGDQRGEVTCMLNEPFNGAVDIFFMSRNTSDRNNYAWVYFESLSFESEMA